MLNPKTWYNTDYGSIELPESKISNSSILSQISPENIASNFSNYQINSNPQRKELFDIMQKFALTINQKSINSEPHGLIISGKPGIGKTHLSIAVMKTVTKNVLYVDEAYLSNLYQKKGGVQDDYTSWFQNIELIILDDLNTKYGIGATFFKKSINYIIRNNKSILVSSNTHLDLLYEALPYYIGYDDNINNNFLILNDIIIPSFRNPWTSTYLELNNIQRLELLARYS